ncbi:MULTISPECIES: LysM-like peptidoglycan-binding domain-containing protein [Providencia]|uniref:LysM-like peptidoglycan-binding domain-containing protein n=1 Tax=Providencia TaxID=586 RepID=UPI0023495821|nr:MULTISPECIES: LysM-like peptidoglycan-binding domain-containing protein [unclassified Providencia]ELR5287614.1 cell envelope opacity-associated protein A [Providencia rettgeri]MDT5427821.1 LysM-like peptidoglycan-binding domain-containing protein [Providencia rettgeri]
MFKLSKFHRYGIALLALIVVVAFFWPTSDKSPSDIVQNHPIVIPPPTTPEVMPESTITPPVPEPVPTPEGNSPLLPTEPEIIPEPIEPTPNEPPIVTSPEKAPEPKTTRPSTSEWQNYRVQKGKTLAQLFRDNNLQANDAFIMARVEGAEKPLSNLRQGQKIRLKANSKGEVQLLETTGSDGKTYSFARLSDGSYYRTP